MNEKGGAGVKIPRFMLAAPNTADNVHLKMLSSLAVGLMDDDFREALKDATDVDQIIDIFKSKKEE